MFHWSHPETTRSQNPHPGRVGLSIVVHGNSEQSSRTSLAVDHDALTIGADERDGQISHVGMLEVDEQFFNRQRTFSHSLVGDELT